MMQNEAILYYNSLKKSAVFLEKCNRFKDTNFSFCWIEKPEENHSWCIMDIRAGWERLGRLERLQGVATTRHSARNFDLKTLFFSISGPFSQQTVVKNTFFGRNFSIWFTFESTDIALQLGAGPKFPNVFSRHSLEMGKFSSPLLVARRPPGISKTGSRREKITFFGRNFYIRFTFEPTEIALQLGAGPKFSIFFSRH